MLGLVATMLTTVTHHLNKHEELKEKMEAFS